MTASHVLSIGIAMDRGIARHLYRKPPFDGDLPAKQPVTRPNPELTIVVCNDHGLEVSLGRVPAFGIGAAASCESGDDGWGPRPIASLTGGPKLSWHLIEQRVARGFDKCLFWKMTVDHGFTVPMSVFVGGPGAGWTNVRPASSRSSS